MTWEAFHRRGEVLRTVLEHAGTHRDGRLPMELPGVAETFGDELSLVGALLLRWHTRLAGAIERELMGRPVDLQDAVVTAWRRTATELAGLRAILDACMEQPHSADMARMLEKAQRSDWTLLAAMAGKASPADERAWRVGRAIERHARESCRPTAAPGATTPGRQAQAQAQAQAQGRAQGRGRPSLLRRVKARLAA